MLKEYLPIISTLHLLFLGPVLCCQVVTDQIWLDGLLLKTDDVATPLSVFIDQIQPKISYSLRQLPSERPVCQQTARRMHVFDVEDQTFVWNDSDWITSTDNIGIEWNGTDLASNRRYTLWIDILNSDATVTTSPNVSFGTAMMAQHCPNGDCWQSAGWLAADITPESDCESFGHHPVQMLRHTMTLPKSVSRAYLHVVGLGWYQAFVNGKRVGDRALDPALSVYNETVFYTTYDVTANISKGDNVLGVLLGRGWFNNVHMHLFGKFDLHQIMTSGHERARTVLSVRYTDGSEASFPSQSGPDWQCAADLHPVVQNSVFFGEVVELNRHPDIEGWSTSSYQPTSAWSTCLPTDGTVTREGITTQLPTPSLHRMEGIFERETILPIAVTPLSATSVLVDFGVEFSGGVDVTLRHQPPMPDDDVMFIYGEQLNASSGGVDGASLYPGALGRWEQGNTSVWGPCAFSWPPTGRVTGVSSTLLRTTGATLPYTYRPTFTFHTARFMEIHNVQPTTATDWIRGYRFYTAMERSNVTAQSPSFSSPNALILEEIDVLAYGSFESNWAQGIQSDCPGRERLGYGGDMLASSEAAMYMYSAHGFYRKRVQDYADSRRHNAGLPETAPYMGIKTCDTMGEGAGPMQWGSTMLHTLQLLYTHYGEVDAIKKHVKLGQEWLGLLNASSRSSPFEGPMTESTAILANGLPGFNHGAISCSSGPFIEVMGTSFFHQQASLLANLCGLINDTACQASASELANVTKMSFQRYLVHSNGSVGTGSDDELIYAIALGLLSDEQAKAAAAVLQDNYNQRGYFDVDAFGVWLLRHLFAYGLGPSIWEWITSTTFPSYGFFIRNNVINATTMFEHWHTPTANDSHNHAWLNSISLLFRSHLVGLLPSFTETGKAWRRFEVRPWPVMPAAQANFSGAVGTLRGPAVVHWMLEGQQLLLTVRTPVGTCADVFVPTTTANSTVGDCSLPVLGHSVLGGILFDHLEMCEQRLCTFVSKFET